MLYYGLNALKTTRRTTCQRLKAIPRNCLEALKTAADQSHTNFRNKVYLLEAEISSTDRRNEEAMASYAAAITSARCSGFTHEVGLACELAAYHCKKVGDNRRARGLFCQALDCYTKWGSQMKVDSVTRQLELIY